ncbi:hypothetical protein K505DRAFT_230491, partial [Melanomma pulvis-pyrius CBS 109.77]
LCSEPITTVVGNPGKKFFVHETLLRTNSAFFEKALGSNWKESNEKDVKLPEVDPEDFNAYLRWLYTGRLYLIKHDDDDDDHDDDGDDTIGEEFKLRGEWGRWAEYYKLGDFVQDSGFQDALVDALIERVLEKYHYPIFLPPIVYKHSTSGSIHRKLLVDLVVCVWDHEHFSMLSEPAYGNPVEYLGDILRDLGPKLKEGLEYQTLEEFLDGKSSCHYHEHRRLGKPCYKAKPGPRF